jgi:hypothetical protein
LAVARIGTLTPLPRVIHTNASVFDQSAEPWWRVVLTPKETGPMLYTIAIVLVVLWLLGLVGGYALGGLIHLLLVIAIVILAIRLFTGRRVV